MNARIFLYEITFFTVVKIKILDLWHHVDMQEAAGFVCEGHNKQIIDLEPLCVNIVCVKYFCW
jgi:hypothetical protein